jgi:hypothetical protein
MAEVKSYPLSETKDTGEGEFWADFEIPREEQPDEDQDQIICQGHPQQEGEPEWQDKYKSKLQNILANRRNNATSGSKANDDDQNAPEPEVSAAKATSRRCHKSFSTGDEGNTRGDRPLMMRRRKGRNSLSPVSRGEVAKRREQSRMPASSEQGATRSQSLERESSGPLRRVERSRERSPMPSGKSHASATRVARTPKPPESSSKTCPTTVRRAKSMDEHEVFFDQLNGSEEFYPKDTSPLTRSRTTTSPLTRSTTTTIKQRKQGGHGDHQGSMECKPKDSSTSSKHNRPHSTSHSPRFPRAKSMDHSHYSPPDETNNGSTELHPQGISPLPRLPPRNTSHGQRVKSMDNNHVSSNDINYRSTMELQAKNISPVNKNDRRSVKNSDGKQAKLSESTTRVQSKHHTRSKSMDDNELPLESHSQLPKEGKGNSSTSHKQGKTTRHKSRSHSLKGNSSLRRLMQDQQRKTKAAAQDTIDTIEDISIDDTVSWARETKKVDKSKDKNYQRSIAAQRPENLPKPHSEKNVKESQSMDKAGKRRILQGVGKHQHQHDHNKHSQKAEHEDDQEMSLEDLIPSTDHLFHTSTMGSSRFKLGISILAAGGGVNAPSKNHSKKNASLESREVCVEGVSEIRSLGNDYGHGNNNEKSCMHNSYSISNAPKMGGANLTYLHSSGSGLNSTTTAPSNERSKKYQDVSVVTDPCANNHEEWPVRQSRDATSGASSGSSNDEDRLKRLKERRKDAQLRSSTGSSPRRDRRERTNKDSHLRSSNGASPSQAAK